VVTFTVEMLAVYGPGASLLASPVGSLLLDWSFSLCTIAFVWSYTSFFAQSGGSLLRCPAVNKT
jgi:hypothetical protein